MTHLLNGTTVSEVATPIVLTLQSKTKLEKVAKFFLDYRIDAAPVVDGFGKCIGIITNQDLVRYESQKPSLNKQFCHGVAFELIHHTDCDTVELEGRPFDDVAYHMTRVLKTIAGSDSLWEASQAMHREGVHHLLLLDEDGRPEGMISKFDISEKIAKSGKSFVEMSPTIK